MLRLFMFYVLNQRTKELNENVWLAGSLVDVCVCVCVM